jgi:hypothetical protein
MKKTLLIATAALAVGVISSQAQPVYSANVVGYVNVVYPANQFVLASNPLDDGTNTANSILAALPNKSSIQVWDGVSAFQLASKVGGSFSPNFSIPVGKGFFVKSAANVTNTYVGNVIPNPGFSTTNSLPNNTFVLVGSTIAVGGNLNDVGTNTINLNATLPNKSSVQVWDVPSQTFVLSSKVGGSLSPNLPVGVAQGFFVKSAGATNWIQNFAP